LAIRKTPLRRGFLILAAKNHNKNKRMRGDVSLFDKTVLKTRLFTGIYGVTFVAFLALQLLPQTGILSIAKEIGLAVFSIVSALFIGYTAICHIRQPKWTARLALCGAFMIACFGSYQTVAVATDIAAGPQTIALTECEVFPARNKPLSIAFGFYSIRGYDETENPCEFPISDQEYRSLVRQIDSQPNKWQTQITGYINCRRIITFTACFGPEDIKK
jgi:hypothetical protein